MATPHMKDASLKDKHCVPCEGGVKPLTPDEAKRLLKDVPGWDLTNENKAIRREWVLKDFGAATQLFDHVAELAETENHHPDFHLTGYRNVAIEISTHAIGGLSENDFILAAKINEIPVKLKGR